MGRIKRFRRGERVTQFPAESWNRMARIVDGLANQPSDSDDRKPKTKSPVEVQLIWSGESALPPGATVELGAAVFDPTTSDSAPFSGLRFHCSAFSGAAELSDYAITMGPIAGGGQGVGYGIMPEAYWAKVNVSDAGHTNAIIAGAGTMLASADTGGLRIVWKPSGTGEKWCVVSLAGSGSTSLPPLRAFELTANKTLASATATAKWLDLDGNLIGDNVTLHDPEHRFSGRIEDDLYSGSSGFRGYALLRTDLAAEDPDQWDIVEMDSLYEFIKAEFVKVSNYPSSGNTVECRYQEEINQLGYYRHPPVEADDPVGYVEDADIFDPDDHVSDVSDSEPGESSPVPVLMQLTDPDTDPPTYRVYEVKASGAGDSQHIYFARATSGITAADGPLQADWGGGSVKLQNLIDGTLDASPTSVDNLLIGVEFVEDSQVVVDTAFAPPRVITGTCDAVSWE